MLSGKNIVSITGTAIGITYIFFVLSFIVGEGIPDLIQGKYHAPLPFLVIFIAGSCGFLFSFRKKSDSVLLMVSSGISMSIYLLVILNYNDVKTSLVLSLPFLISGAIRYYTTENKMYTSLSEKN